MTHLTTCPDAETVAERAAAHVSRELRRAREERGAAHIALSGGTTPVRTYELLALSEQDWEGVEVWFADERCVAPGDDQSNYRLAEQALLLGAEIDASSVHRMEGELGPADGARRYARLLAERVPATGEGRVSSNGTAQGAHRRRRAQSGPPVLDIVVLGIGPDGHVASLFPEAASLEAADGTLCVGVLDSPKPPPERITLSLEVLRAARGCLLLATGSSKADAVTAMLADQSPRVPASLLRRERLTVIMDDAAAPQGPVP